MLPAPPDHMVFDLDPGEGTPSWSAAGWPTDLVEALDEGARGCWPKTSGSKGLQLYVPLSGRPTWEKVRDRAHELAGQLEREHPELVVSNMRRSLRERQGAHRLEPEPSGQDHGRRLLAAGPGRADGRRPRWPGTRSTRCAHSGDPADLRFTADVVLERIGTRRPLRRGVAGPGSKSALVAGRTTPQAAAERPSGGCGPSHESK